MILFYLFHFNGDIVYISTIDSGKGSNRISRKQYDTLKKGYIKISDLSKFETPELIEHYDSFYFYKRG